MTLFGVLSLAVVAEGMVEDPVTVPAITQTVNVTRVIPFAHLPNLNADGTLKAASNDVSLLLASSTGLVDALDITAHLTGLQWGILDVVDPQPEYTYVQDSDGYVRKICSSVVRITVDDGGAPPILVELVCTQEV